MAKYDDIRIRLSADATQFEKGFKSAEQSAKVFERELARVEKATRDMAAQEAAAYREQEQMAQKSRESYGKIGAAVGVASAAVVAGFAAAVKTAADFEFQMSSVQAATGESSQAMGKLRDAALEAGATTVYSATEAAGAIEQLAKAGVSTADILDGGLKGSLDLAAAGGIAVADAAEAMASTMTQFNLEGSQASHVADLLAAAAGKAQGGVSDMNYAFGQAGIVASQFGISVETTTATLAAFASAGLLGSDAGTSFKTMLLALANPSEKSARAMQELGISAYDAQGNFVGIADLAEQLQTKLGGLTEEQRNSALATIFGSDAMRAAAILYNEGGQGIADWTEKVNDSGFAAEQAEARMDNLTGALEEMHGALETAMITLGGGKLGDGIRFFVDQITTAINLFNELPAPIKNDIQFLGALGGAVGLLGAGVLLLIPKIAEIKEVLTSSTRVTNAATAAMARFGTVASMTALTVGAVWAGTQIADYLTKVDTSADQTTQAMLGIANGSKVARSSFDLFDTKFLGATVNDVTSAEQAVRQFGLVANEAAGGGLSEFYHTVASLGGNKRQFTDYVDAIDASLSNLVANGRAEEAKETFEAFKEAAMAEGMSADDFDDRFGGYAAALDSAAAAAKSAETGLYGYASAAASATGQAEELSEAQAELRKEMVEGMESFISPLGAYQEALADKEKAERESAEATAASTEDSADSWEDYAKTASLSVDEYIAKLQEQIDAQRNWETNLLQLKARGLPNAILQQLTALGEEGAPVVQQFVDATNEQFQTLQDVWPTATQDATQGVADMLMSQSPVLQQIAETAGIATARGYAERLADGTSSVLEITGEYARVLAMNIPDEATTEVMVDGVPVARSRILEVKRAMDQYLVDKSILITATVRSINAAGDFTNYGGRPVATGQGGSGGQVIGKREGGFISGPGGPTEDRIPAMLSDGEFVVRAAATKRHLALLTAINSGQNPEEVRARFATGGLATRADITLPNPDGVRSGLNSQVAPQVQAIQKAAQAAADAASAAAAAAASAAESPGDASGAPAGSSSGPGGIGWQWQMATLRKVFPGLAMNSGPRSGKAAITATGNPSWHGKGRAVDVPPRRDVFNWIRANYGLRSKELIFSPAGSDQLKNGRSHVYSGVTKAMHYNHVHWAYDQGGMANAMGPMLKLTNKPERVLSPRQTQSFERLVELLGGTKMAEGGLVSRGSRASSPVAGNNQDGTLRFNNGFDLPSYLARTMKPVDQAISDAKMRETAFAAIHWTSLLRAEEEKLTRAKELDEAATDSLRDAESEANSARRDVEAQAESVARAEKARAKANSGDADDRKRADEDLAEARKELTDAQVKAAAAEAKLTGATNAAKVASGELARQDTITESVRDTATTAAERAAKAEEELNDAKQKALDLAEKIRDAELSRANAVSLFKAEDPKRAQEYAEYAWQASLAEAQAATDAGEWQAKLDQVAAAGAKLAAAQTAMGASFVTTQATMQAARDAVYNLALGYGFSADEARRLADSAVAVSSGAQQAVESMERQIEQMLSFSSNLAKLREMGLNADTIAQIVEAGAQEGGALAASIIASGTGMVNRMNDAQKGLQAAADRLAQQESAAVYQPPAAGGGLGPGKLVPLPQVISNAPVIPRVTRGVRLLADGGLISGPGGPRDDQVPVWASPGEFMVKAAAVNRYGSKFFDDANAMRLAVGGQVGRPVRGSLQPVVNVNLPETAPNPGVGSLFGGPVTIQSPVDLDMVLSRAKFALGGALGTAGGFR